MKNETLLARRLNWAKALLPLLCLALAGAAYVWARYGDGISGQL